MLRFQQLVLLLVLTILCNVDSWAIDTTDPLKRTLPREAKDATTSLNTRRSFRTKRDDAEAANVHSMLSETNSLASAAESIQAAENSMAAGLEAEKSRKAFKQRVPKSVMKYPPEPKVREFIPDNQPTYDDEYYDDYDDYYYDTIPNVVRHDEFHSVNHQNHNRLPPQPQRLSPNFNLNTHNQYAQPRPALNMNRNFNAHQERSFDRQTLNLHPNPQQQPNPAKKEAIDLRKVYWLKLPDKLTDQTVHQKVDAIFGEVSGEGHDVLVIPVSREFTSSDDVSDGFMKALGLRSALRRAKRLRRMKMDMKQFKL